MILKTTVAITKKIGLYQPMVKFATKHINKRKQKYFHKYGLEALLQADKAFKSVGSFIFPTFGTLLGAYRDKMFIPHDFDLDVGFLKSDEPENMDALLKSYGFKHVKQYYIKETGLVVEDTYTYKGVQVDFFKYFKKDDKIYCYISRNHETKHWQEANKTDGFPSDLSWVAFSTFSEMDFLGHKVLMPVKTKEWLKDIYGDSFMIPIKDWVAKDYSTQIKRHTERLYRRYFD